MLGASNDGKSMLMIDLLVRCAAGLPWANKYNIQRPLTSLYCTAEGQSGISNRFRAAAHALNVSEEVLDKRIHLLPCVPSLYSDKSGMSVSALINRCRMSKVNKLDIMVIDTLTHAIGEADENNAQDALKCMCAVKSIAEELGCAVIIVHHLNKTGAQSRGSSQFINSVEFALLINRKKSYFQLVSAKERDLPAMEPLAYRIVAGEHDSAYIDWIEDEGSSRSMKQRVFDIAKSFGRPFMSSDVMNELGDSVTIQNVANVLKELTERKYLSRSSKWPDRPAGRTNPWVYRVIHVE